MKPSLFVGVDLTDSYARAPREVDVAILDAQTGQAVFDKLLWPSQGADCARAAADLAGMLGTDKAVLMADGPQALATMPNNTPLVERYLGTPGHTPWQVPEPRTRPFAGYIRTSIEFFDALIGAGFKLAELAKGENSANLFEAYPGAAWPRWHRCAQPLGWTGG